MQSPRCVLNAISVASVDGEILQEIQEGYRQDSLYSKGNSERPPNVNLADDGTWWYSEGKDDKRLCIPDCLKVREKLLLLAHDTQLPGHLGVNKTVAQLRRRFWWPGMAESVADYIRTCGLCQGNKPSSRRKLGLMQSLPIPDRRWGSVSMDQIVELPTTERGFDYIVVYVDRLTKMMHCQPTHTNVKAPALAKLLFASTLLSGCMDCPTTLCLIGILNLQVTSGVSCLITLV